MKSDAHRILLVDDDRDILKILKDNLELDGYKVFTAVTGKEALRSFEDYGVELVILDLSLPDVDGIQVCRLIRERSDVPIIMLTARDRIPDKVLGLESGADDYMSKPFDYLELAARIKACLRRHARPGTTEEIMEFGHIKIDAAKKLVWKRGDKITLTQRQFNLLLLLAAHRDTVLERSAIRRALWPDGDVYKDSRAIDVHIQHLRSKLEDHPSDPKRIVTVQGVGYMLKTNED
jgi:DNA-binding response OmpR family regulator